MLMLTADPEYDWMFRIKGFSRFPRIFSRSGVSVVPVVSLSTPSRA